MTPADASPGGCDAWNPGLQSDIPWPLLPLATLFRPENVLTAVDHVHELAASPASQWRTWSSSVRSGSSCTSC